MSIKMPIIKMMSNRWSGIWMFLIYMMIAQTTMAQNQRVISGAVLDEIGEGLPGATIMELGTSNGTVTDIDGTFTLKTGSSATLVVDFIGYLRKEVQVLDISFLKINMELDVQSLEEVVVVGYGEQTKQTLTGSVEQVKAEVFENRAITNPALSLQGQTPGLVISRTSPRPGNEDLTLQIRGATSINGGEPLVLIDGVPTLGLGEFYDMNPDDIASVSVLKDGSASIFGSRAANGVIIVTTRRGKGSPQISYSNNFRVGVTGIRPPTPSMQEYANMFLEAVEQDGSNDYWGWQTKENLERMATGEEGIYSTQFWDDIYIGDYDRFDDLFGYSYSQQHNLSVSGANEKSNYRISGMLADNRGALKTAYDGKKNYNIRFNYNMDITDKLSLESGIVYQRSEVSSPSTGLDASSASYDPPFFPALNPYGDWHANFNIAGNRNSVAATTDGGRNDRVQDLTKLNLALQYDIMDGLDFKVTGSFNKRDTRQDLYRVTVQPYTWNGDSSAEQINPAPLYAVREWNRTYLNFGAYFNYSKTFNNLHAINVMVGLTGDKQEEQRVYAERAGFIDQGVYDLNVAPEGTQTTGGGHDQWGLYGYLARINYDYKGKYLVELLGRRDGSSRFDVGHKWDNFGSFSLGWVLSEEAFLKGIQFVSFLKLRGGYGEMGNLADLGTFDYVTGISNGSIPFGSSPSLQSSARINGITSNVRSWERVGQTNIGLDVAFLTNKLSGAVDLFKKVNDGMLASRVYPDVLGGTAPKTNVARLETKGWEAVLSYKDQIGDFQYKVGINMSDTRNEVVKLDGADAYEPGLNMVREGYPLNSYFMYETDGLFSSQEMVDAYYAEFGGGGEVPVQSDPLATLRPGDIIKVDLDGNGIIQGVSPDGGDLKYMGDASPHYVYGINLGANFKGFDLNAMFQGVLNQNVQRTGFLSQPFFTLFSNQPTSYIGKTWTPEQTDAEYPRLTTQTGRARYNWQNNDFALQNNRYMRLKSLVIGYTLPSAFTERIKMDKVRVFFSGNDLFEMTSVKDGFDPEYGESSQTIYPFQRTFAMGVDIRF